MQPQLHVLGEAGGAMLADVRSFARVQPQVSLQVTTAAEALVTHLHTRHMT